MLPVLLAQLGLPLLMKAAGSALSQIDHPAARAAAEAVAEAGATLSPDQLAEANRHLERMAELDSAEVREVIAQVNQSLRTEATAEDAYVRRWRPTFGYAMALSWTATMGSVAWAVVMDPVQAPAIIAALVNSSAIWGVALGVLGISVVKRSQDKGLAMPSGGVTPPPATSPAKGR